MSTTKQDYNAACQRLIAADHQIGKLTHQILQARERALDCKRKADQLRVLPGDASLEEHAAAAVGIAAEYAKFEGERRYWVHYHEQLMGQIVGARNEAVASKQACGEVVSNFWRDRFAEQLRAFLERNKSAMADLYGTYARLTESSPSGDEFWNALRSRLPDMGFLKSGLWATEKVIPSDLPETTHLRPIDSAEHRMPAHMAEFLRVGPRADADHIAALRQGAEDAVGLISDNEEKLQAARKKVDAAEAALAEVSEGLPPRSDSHLERIEEQKSLVRVARHELKMLEEKGRDLVGQRFELMEDLRKAEDELAKLEAVKVV